MAGALCTRAAAWTLGPAHENRRRHKVTVLGIVVSTLLLPPLQLLLA